MSQGRALTGACSCGRNRYIVEVPHESTDAAQVLFDNSHNQRKSQKFSTPYASDLTLCAIPDNPIRPLTSLPDLRLAENSSVLVPVSHLRPLR